MNMDSLHTNNKSWNIHHNSAESFLQQIILFYNPLMNKNVQVYNKVHILILETGCCQWPWSCFYSQPFGVHVPMYIVGTTYAHTEDVFLIMHIACPWHSLRVRAVLVY